MIISTKYPANCNFGLMRTQINWIICNRDSSNSTIFGNLELMNTGLWRRNENREREIYNNNNNNNNNMSCLPRVASSVFTLFSLRALQSYYYPGHQILAYPHTMYAHSPLLGSIPASASFLQAHIC